MIFKIDCDGVLRDLLGGMCDIYNKNFGTHVKPNDCESYDVDINFVMYKQNLGVSAKDWLFNKNGKELFRDSKIFKGAKDAIDMLHNAGHKIIIVTAQRTTKNKIDTLIWLDKHKIYYDDIVFTNNKDQIKGDFMIDDSVDILNTISKPTTPICIKAPYNKKCKSYIKYNSLFDFVIDFLNKE